MSLIQTPWTSQPQQDVGIDWGNPITRGLISAITPHSARVLSVAGTAQVIASQNGAQWDGINKNLANGFVCADRNPIGGLSVSSQRSMLTVGTIRGLPDSGTQGYVATLRNTLDLDTDSALFISFVNNGGINYLRGSSSNGHVFDSIITSSNLGRFVASVSLPTANYADTKLYLNGGIRSADVGTNGSGFFATINKYTIAGRASSANRSLNGGVALVAVWSRALSDDEHKSLSINPWQIFRPLPRRIFVPVATGGSDVTITGNIGDATAAGLTATVSQAASIAAGVGNATASGLTATITASGLTTISCATGNASAAGSQAVVNSAATVTCSVGNAAAAGLTAALDTAYTILANVGNATADGLSATIQAATGISCGVANAIAAGLTASVTNNAPLTDSEKIDLILDILSNRQTLDPSTGVYTLYADDGVTVLKTAQAWEDAAGTIPYRGRALQRLDGMQ